MVPSFRTAGPVMLLLLSLAAASCADASAPFHADPQFNKTKGGGPNSGNPSVTSVDPPYAYQGEVINGVRIFGSNYAEGAQAAWERNGVPDPRIVVHQTRYVSASELEADITILEDAEMGAYNVAVTLVGGKRGVGIESFEVKSRVTNPTPTFYVPNSGSDITGDGTVTAGTESVYANRTCSLSTVVYRDGTGDAILDMPTKLSGNPKSCPGLRTLRFRWPDGYQESLVTRVNVGAAGASGATGIYGIPPGASNTMAMNIQIPASKRCTTLKFRWYYLGDTSRPSVGGEDVTVTALAPTVWRVVGQKAECTRPDGTLAPIEMSVVLTIVE